MSALASACHKVAVWQAKLKAQTQNLINRGLWNQFLFISLKAANSNIPQNWSGRAYSHCKKKIWNLINTPRASSLEKECKYLNSIKKMQHHEVVISDNCIPISQQKQKTPGYDQRPKRWLLSHGLTNAFPNLLVGWLQPNLCKKYKDLFYPQKEKVLTLRDVPVQPWPPNIKRSYFIQHVNSNSNLHHWPSQLLANLHS